MANTSDRVAEIEKFIESVKGYMKGAIGVLVIFAAFLGWWTTQELMPAIHGMDKTLREHTERFTKMQSAIDVLTSTQSNQTQKLIHDLLAAAKTTHEPAIAAKAIETAASLTATLREDKRPASPEFFQTSIEVLNQLPPSKPAFLSRVALAQYRSAIEPVPEWLSKIVVGKGWTHAFVMTGPDSGISGEEIDAQNVKGDVVVLGPALRGKMSENVIFDDDKIVGASQTLDGIHWRNTIFVGTHIRYKGGEVELTNVRFVNCTFEFPDSERGRQVVDYAALLPSSPLTIG
jgi:hypothetical protein